MTESRYCLLDEPLLRLSLPGEEGRRRASLPEVLAHLGLAEELDFAGLRPHQGHAWHAFLTQLAALALRREPDLTPERPTHDWRRLLLSLTGGRTEPWCLVVDDPALPALLQPPAAEGSLDGYRPLAVAPDEIDVLVTAKNHDVKSQVMAYPEPEHWLYALVSLQTTGGYTGRDNYGVSRMNGGFASRPGLAATGDLGWPARFRRDVKVWLEGEAALLASEDWGYRRDGLALLWLAPWDGLESLTLQDLHPFYIEVCRRIRILEETGRLVAYYRPTKAPRIAASQAMGNTGDVWTPIKRGEAAALTVGPSGFSYGLVQKVLFESDFQLSGALQLRDEDGEEPVLVAQALVRGQGKTDGWRERHISMARRAAGLFRTAEGRAEIGVVSERWVDHVAKVRNAVLRPAVCALLQAGADKLDFRDRRADRWVDRLDALVDEIFFDRLWQALGKEMAAADRPFLEEVRGLARSLLEEAIRSTPLPSVRRYRAIAAAERFFEGASRKHFGWLYPTTPTTRGGSTDDRRPEA